MSDPKENRNSTPKVPAMSFIQFICSNVDNENLNDHEFREMIRKSLPIVEFSTYTERHLKINGVLKNNEK